MADIQESNDKEAAYVDLRQRLDALLSGEDEEVSVMSTIACELHHAFATMNWVGFYRVVSEGLLKVGPYQGGHGCLSIPFDRGVCGRCATEKRTQLVNDVNALPYHIACSSSTRSEIVVPVLDNAGKIRAVLDVDSDQPAAFDALDQRELEAISARLTCCYPRSGTETDTRSSDD